VNILSAALAVLFSVDGSGGRPPAPAGPAATVEAAPAAAPATPAQPTLAAVAARIDELHQHRDDHAAWAEEQRLVQTALARAPQDYGLLWRGARLYFWASDDPGLSSELRSKSGKEGWDLAERAIAVNHNDVAGFYFAAVCMGNYALGLGIVTALSKGLEGKFRDRLGTAEKLNLRFERGAIDTAWGRFYEKLPWPKRDRPKAEEHLRRALQVGPNNLRARVYLAETFLEEDRPQEAKRLLDEVTAAPVGRDDPPEDRRAKALATGLLPQVAAKLR
jgi:tetratricopeptide (TPR) repeat protein